MRHNPLIRTRAITATKSAIKTFYHRGHRGKGEKRSENAPQSANPYPRYYCNKIRYKNFFTTEGAEEREKSGQEMRRGVLTLNPIIILFTISKLCGGIYDVHRGEDFLSQRAQRKAIRKCGAGFMVFAWPYSRINAPGPAAAAMTSMALDSWPSLVFTVSASSLAQMQWTLGPASSVEHT